MSHSEFPQECSSLQSSSEASTHFASSQDDPQLSDYVHHDESRDQEHLPPVREAGSSKLEQDPRIFTESTLSVVRLWLDENYESAKEISIPRSIVYQNYLDFCYRHGIEPEHIYPFGKQVRETFPEVEVKRLRTRGLTHYDYYGIAVRCSSPYFQQQYSLSSSRYVLYRDAIDFCLSHFRSILSVPLLQRGYL